MEFNILHNHLRMNHTHPKLLKPQAKSFTQQLDTAVKNSQQQAHLNIQILHNYNQQQYHIFQA